MEIAIWNTVKIAYVSWAIQIFPPIIHTRCHCRTNEFVYLAKKNASNCPPVNATVCAIIQMLHPIDK